MADPYVLFDLDGTLTDPKEGITNCIRYAMERLGEPVASDTDLDWCIGPPLQASLQQLLGDPPDDAAERALAFYRERFVDVGLLENEVYPEIPGLLAELRTAGIRLLIATSKPTIYAQRIADHFGLSRYFERVYGSELDGRLTDKKELLRVLLTSENIAARDCVMIGDRRHDIEGARANAIPVIAVSWGYGSEAELAAAGPDAVCDAPGQLLQAVRRFHET